jgi:uncharacterized protein (TIGR00369 family)
MIHTAKKVIKMHKKLSQKEFTDALHMVMKRSTKEKDRMNASLRLTLVSCKTGEQEEAVFRYETQTLHLNPYGGLHGGIVCALIDTCMGTAVAARTDHKVITTDLSVSYLRALKGSAFRIQIEFTHLGHHMSSVIGRIYNEDDNELSATGMGTFMLLNTGDAGVQV